MFMMFISVYILCGIYPYLILLNSLKILLDFSLTVKAAPHECVIRTSQP